MIDSNDGHENEQLTFRLRCQFGHGLSQNFVRGDPFVSCRRQTQQAKLRGTAVRCTLSTLSFSYMVIAYAFLPFKVIQGYQFLYICNVHMSFSIGEMNVAAKLKFQLFELPDKGDSLRISS